MATMVPSKRKFLNTSTVTLVVGGDKIPLIIHRDAICEVSTVFRAAFMKEFKEATEMKMELPEDIPDVVDLFAQWVYTTWYEVPSIKMDGHKNSATSLLHLVQLFVFADRYGVTSLKKYTIRQMVDCVTQHGVNYRPCLSSVGYAYENTTPSSGIRKFLTDWYCWGIRTTDFELAKNELLQIPEFAVDLVLELHSLSAPAPASVHQTNPFKVKDPDSLGKYYDDATMPVKPE